MNSRLIFSKQMFLVAIASLFSSVAAECWKVPDSLGIENTVLLMILDYKQLLDGESVSDTQESHYCIMIYERV